MRKSGGAGNPVVSEQRVVDLTARQWKDEEIRAAQLRLADEALTKKDPRKWLAEMLDILGLLPTDQRRVGRYRTNISSTKRRNVPIVETDDVTTTDLERGTSRIVDTQGHGTIEGYQMHIKRYERPCGDCLATKKFYDEYDALERGITLHDNHTVGYQ
jgi:hypothetical protein